VTITDLADKVQVLTQALPYIRRFWGRVVVVKYGGHAMADPALADTFAQDIVLMRSVGMRPVVVHGGGPQIGEVMGRLGKVPEFHDGLRVTDAETLDIARMVLVGKVNRDIVSAINVHAPLAIGLSGEDGGLITAAERDPRLGFVGDVTDVNPQLLQRLLAEDLIPVVSTIGSGVGGQAYNINADTVASAVAQALGAHKLVYLTDIGAVELEALVAGGTVSQGMIPKVEGCTRAIAGGVAQAHIVDGRIPHVLLLEFFTDEGIGTMILPDDEVAG